MWVEYDAFDDCWFVMTEEDGRFYEEAGPFASEQDAYDWMENFGDA